MNVESIMSKDITYVSPEDSISKVISLIEKKFFREIIIMENKKLKGIVYSKDIAKKGIIDPSKAKASNFMNSNPPSLSPRDDVVDAAKLIFKTGLRALPVVDKDKVVVGLLCILCHALSNLANANKVDIGC